MGIPALRGNGRRLVQPRNPHSGATGEKNPPFLSNNTRQGDYLSASTNPYPRT